MSISVIFTIITTHHGFDEDITAANVVEVATRNGEGRIALKERHWWEGTKD